MAVGLGLRDHLHDFKKAGELLPPGKIAGRDVQVSPLARAIEQAHGQDFKLVNAIGTCGCAVLRVARLLQLHSAEVIFALLVT